MEQVSEENIFYDESGKSWITSRIYRLPGSKRMRGFEIEGETSLKEWMYVYMKESSTEPEHYILTPSTDFIDGKLRYEWDMLSINKKCDKINKYSRVIQNINVGDISGDLKDFQIKSMSFEKYISVDKYGKNIKPARKID